MDAFFYKFHPKFNIYEEFLMTSKNIFNFDDYSNFL